MTGKQPPRVRLDEFQPIDPWKSHELVVRSRKLPHLEVTGATYFVTFRCHSTLQLPPAARDRVMAAIRALDHDSIDLEAAVVMPEHVHAIFRLIAPHSLSQVLQLIKGRSSRQINQLLQRKGRVWLVESFDHIIRNAEASRKKWSTSRKIHQNGVSKIVAGITGGCS